MNYGTPLRQTHPAEVERFIVDKVRADIGKELLPYVVLRPSLEVDREEGDISGNMTAGYGAVEIKVDERSLYLPFLIQNRELMPFEVIRMGQQEVGYSPERLRTIIINLRERAREDEEDGDLVARDQVTSGNGFLGTIMSIRDEENMRNMNGMDYEQDGFGLMEQARMMQRSADEVDTFEVLEKVATLIEGATVIPADAVDSFLDTIEKTASVLPDTSFDKAAELETLKAEQIAKEIDGTKLIDFRKHRSGNNVYLPLFHQADGGGTFEKVPGRVYHNVETFGKEVVKVDGIVIGPSSRFKLVTDATQRLMTYRDNAPEEFDPRRVRAIDLVEGGVYTYEVNEQTVISPFVVAMGVEMVAYDGVDRQREPLCKKHIDKAFHIESFASRGQWAHEYTGVIVTPTVKEPKTLGIDEAIKHFAGIVGDPDEAWAVNVVLRRFHKKLVLLPSGLECFPLLQLMNGTYDKDDLLPEKLFAKTAAYNRHNALTLKAQGYEKPPKFTVEWSIVETNGGGPARAERVNRQFEKNLPYEQARNLLLTFGYTHNQVAQFFQTVKRSNRQATMPLPDMKKARELSRDRIGRREKAKRKQTLLSRTVNNQTFGNDLSNILSFGIAAALETAGVGDKSAGIDAFMKKSATLASDLEKKATDLHGEHWLDLAVLANIKHRLDKVACEIQTGALVADADDLFKVASTLVPKIEKLAGELVPFARLQERLPAQQRTDLTFLKEAQVMLDVLYGYATLEKTAGVKDFFSSVNRRGIEAVHTGKERLLDLVDPHRGDVKAAKAGVDRAYDEYRDASVRKGLGDASGYEATIEGLQDAHQQSAQAKLRQAEYDAKLRTMGVIGLSGIAVPGVSGMIGYQSAKAGGQDGTV